MPIDHRIDPACGLVRIEMAGQITAAETLEFLERLASDPALRPAMPQLVDVTRISGPPSESDSQRVAAGFERLRHRFEGARCAVLVRDPLVFGAMRQFATLASGAGVVVRPFAELPDALRWLGVPDTFR